MFKDILIHLDGGDRDPLRIATARGIAERFAGRLTGLFAGSGSHRAEAAERSARQFAEATVGTAATTRWSRLESLLPGGTPADLAITGRLADLLVLGQHHIGKGAPADLIERVVLQSGRPTLVLPSVGAYPTVGSSVVIAWNGSREAARALHMAMPLVALAKSVEVVTIGDADRADGSPSRVVEHLAAHGVAATHETLPGDDIGVMDLLLSHAFDRGADLLVMGARPHPHHLHLFSGSGTRYVLDHMTLPVLMVA